MWWLESAGDLLLGACCGGCGRPGGTLCADCRRVVGDARPFEPVLDPRPPGLPPLLSLAGYAGVWPEVVSAYKEHGMWSLARPLGAALWRALAVLVLQRAAPGTSVVLVPMPSRAAAVRRRGLDTTLTLARHTAARAARIGWSVPVRPTLRLTRRVVDQAGLDAAARRANLSGALTARPVGAHPAPAVVVVDDLVTTGASLAEAARALRSGGHRVLGAVTLAAAVRRTPGGASTAGGASAAGGDA